LAKLVYSAITSLDGYTEDTDGKFDWSAPDADVHQFVNDLERPIGTYLYGRRMYEVMSAWETMGTPEDPAVIQDFGSIWRAAEKIVFSTTLQTVSSARTKLEPSFDPDAIRLLKASSDSDLSIAGPALGAQAIKAGLVDEFHFFLNPISVGGGKPALPLGWRLHLELLDEHRFDNGVVHLHYRAGSKINP